MSSCKQELIAQKIIQAGRFLDRLGLCPATTGNISMRYDTHSIAITTSGIHKRDLSSSDILLVNWNGQPVDYIGKPSAETLLHTMIYQSRPAAEAILHHHTLNGTVLSLLNPFSKCIDTHGYEIHKVFPEIDTHESSVKVPVFDNSQNMPCLADDIKHCLLADPSINAFFLRGHGLYVWGVDMEAAKKYVEAYEFLFASELKLWKLRNG